MKADLPLMKTAPRRHQGEALVRLDRRPRRPSDEDVFAWLMEMGTGKSRVLLEDWARRVAAGDLDDLLVVAPAGAYRNWFREDPEDPGEIQKHLSDEFRGDLLVAHWASGAGVGHRRWLDHVLATSGRPRVLVTNVEALSTVKAARAAVTEFLAPHRAMLAVDESTTVKSPRAERTKFVVRAGGDAPARRILTGLVTPRDPLDLYTQFEFLDWRILGHRSYWSFRRRYAVIRKMMFGGRSVDVVVGFRNVEELHQKIDPYSYRVLKKDCLDIPPKQYAIREVKLTDEQRRIYRELREEATAAIEGENYVTATMVITQILRLQQLLCGFVVDEEGRTHRVPENKTAELVSILEEHGGKAIIWVAWDQAIRQVAEVLRKEFGEESVAMFWGANRSTRHEDERRWKRDPACRFLLSTPGAGGRGNTWVEADLVVYHSSTNNLEHRDQSEDRPHRDGQTRSVQYVDLVAPGTVEERTLHALRKKINMVTVITGENYREWLI